MSLETTSVLVVGGGMVGLSAAMLLAWRGVPTVLVERHPGSSLHPRTMGFTTRTMEIYRAVGLGEQIPQVPPGFGRPRRVKVESLAGAWAPEIHTWTPGTPDVTAGSGPSEALEYSMCTGAAIPQDKLEPIIRERATKLGADIRLSTLLTSFEQDLEGVTAFLRDPEGKDYILRAKYMIAADGHSSRIREALGIGRDGRGYLRTYRSVLFRAPLEQYLESGFSQFQIDQPGLTAMLTTYRDGRWLLMFADDEKREEPTLEALVRRATGLPDLNVEILTTGRWELSGLIADRFASGRVFLAGDAAHTLPPARGGYGANTGIEDVHNLAWKLASVLSGSSAPGLLDTYDDERRPIAWLRHGQIFARPDYAEVARPEDRETAIIDDDAMELGQLYRSAAVCSVEKGLPSAKRPDQWAGQPGTRAAHVWVISEGGRISTLDLVQPGWVLLTQDQRWRTITEKASGQINLDLKCRLIGGPAESAEREHVASPLDIPIELIAADLNGRLVLDAFLTEVMGHVHYETIKAMSLRQLQPLPQGQVSDGTLALIEAELVKVLGGVALLDPVDPNAFWRAYGIGPEGASLIRPDGYIAWRSPILPLEPLSKLIDALRQGSFATTEEVSQLAV